jgi:pyruvate kinase
VVFEGDIFVKKLSKYKYSVPIIFVTDEIAQAKELMLYRGVKSMILSREMCKLQDLNHLQLPFKTGQKILILSFCKSFKLLTVK